MTNTYKKPLLDEKTLKLRKQELNQKNINNALNHFFSRKQSLTIINKILKNYTPTTSAKKPRGFTFGVFCAMALYSV